MIKLGIIGHGFVGKAVDHGFNQEVEKYIVDPKYGEKSIADIIREGVIRVFVCVPTPKNEDGMINASIVESVLQEIEDAAPNDQNILTILKSTVTPDHVRSFGEKFKNIDLVYNPEFLTEKNYLEDFVNPPMHIFGGHSRATHRAQRMYDDHSRCVHCPVYHTDLVTASFIKYTLNTFLAAKVIYFNQMYDLFQTMNPEASWEEFITIIGTDPRMGDSHMMVPGHDGSRGFGGSCFPKDTEALVEFAKQQGQSFTLLEEVLKVNNELR